MKRLKLIRKIPLVLITVILLFPQLKIRYNNQNITIPEIAILIPVLTMLVGGFILGIISIYENLVNKKPQNIQKYFINRWIKSLTEITSKLVIMILFFSFLKLILFDLNPHLSNLRRQILFPEHLINKEILDRRLIKEQNLKFKPKLIHFNDKYFFYEILDGKIKKY